MTSFICLTNDLSLGQQTKLKEGMSLGGLSVVAFRGSKGPTNMFSSTLVFHLRLDYDYMYTYSVCLQCNLRHKRNNNNTKNEFWIPYGLTAEVFRSGRVCSLYFMLWFY